MRVRLSKSFSFEAAHWLPTFPEGHKCRRLHGHSFHVDVVAEGPVSEETGYLIDFGEIKKAIAPIEDALDHRCLNEIDGLENPTAEHLSRGIWDRISQDISCLFEIRVKETCTSECVYRGEA